MKTLLPFLFLSLTISGYSQRQLLGQTQRNYYPSGNVFQDSMKYIYAGQEGAFESMIPKFKFNGQRLSYDLGVQDALVVHCLTQIKRSGFTYNTPIQTQENYTLENDLITQTLFETNSNLRELHEYDADGNRVLTIVENRVTGGPWELYKRYEYSFDADGNSLTFTRYMNYPNPFIHYTDTTWYLAGTDKVSMRISYMNNFATNTPKPSLKSVSSFNGDNIEYIDNFSWVAIDSTWQWTQRSVYLYDAENFCVDEKRYNVIDSVLELTHFNQDVYSYTPTDNISEVVSYDGLGQLIVREFFDYDTYEFIKNRQIYEFDSSGDSTLIENQNFYFDGFLDVKENELESISIYPNPTTGSVKLQLDFELINVTLYNELGQLLLEQNNSELDLSHLDSGVYIIKGETKNGGFQKKVVKK